MFESLIIESPKRKNNPKLKLKEFFPYYAGFPESFAKTVIGSSGLKDGSVVYDPWNGSGTTTTAAMKLGHHAWGIDINPVMVMVARARNLSGSSVDLLEKEGAKLFKSFKGDIGKIQEDDPLLQWFDYASALLIRTVEQRARCLMSNNDFNDQGFELNRYACLASNLYVALFNACRVLTKSFRSSNPTWLRLPKDSEEKLAISFDDFKSVVLTQVKNIADGLRISNSEEYASSDSSIFVGDSTTFVKDGGVDLILTSPPYCTRIDYTAATRVELALVSPMLNVSREELSRSMIGSIRVPKRLPEPKKAWGPTCNEFIRVLQNHSSKASSGYYYKTHVDYFEKMSASMRGLHRCLRKGGGLVMVVQDSFYKDIHNDVPTMLTEMAVSEGFEFCRREDFLQRNSMSGINANSKKYSRPAGATESVICFHKI